MLFFRACSHALNVNEGSIRLVPACPDQTASVAKFHAIYTICYGSQPLRFFSKDPPDGFRQIVFDNGFHDIFTDTERFRCRLIDFFTESRA